MRTFTLIFLSVMILGLTACSGNSSTSSEASATVARGENAAEITETEEKPAAETIASVEEDAEIHITLNDTIEGDNFIITFESLNIYDGRKIPENTTELIWSTMYPDEYRIILEATLKNLSAINYITDFPMYNNVLIKINNQSFPTEDFPNIYPSGGSFLTRVIGPLDEATVYFYGHIYDFTDNLQDILETINFYIGIDIDMGRDPAEYVWKDRIDERYYILDIDVNEASNLLDVREDNAQKLEENLDNKSSESSDASTLTDKQILTEEQLDIILNLLSPILAEAPAEYYMNGEPYYTRTGLTVTDIGYILYDLLHYGGDEDNIIVRDEYASYMECSKDETFKNLGGLLGVKITDDDIEEFTEITGRHLIWVDGDSLFGLAADGEMCYITPLIDDYTIEGETLTVSVPFFFFYNFSGYTYDHATAVFTANPDSICGYTLESVIADYDVPIRETISLPFLPYYGDDWTK